MRREPGGWTTDLLLGVFLLVGAVGVISGLFAAANVLYALDGVDEQRLPWHLFALPLLSAAVLRLIWVLGPRIAGSNRFP